MGAAMMLPVLLPFLWAAFYAACTNGGNDDGYGY